MYFLQLLFIYLVVDLITLQTDPVVLVGHSYAGSVITVAADRHPEHVSALVYLDAFVPADGDSAGSLAADFEAVVFGRIVRGGDHHTGGIPIFADREIERVGRDQAKIVDRAALIADAVDQGGDHHVAGDTHIPPYGDRVDAERKNNAPANLAVLRRLALNILRAEPSPIPLSHKRLKARWKNEDLLHLITHMR